MSVANTGEGAAHHEGGELDAGNVVAEGLGPLLVLADGLQNLAEGGLDDALHDPEREEEKKRDGSVVRERRMDVEAEHVRARDAGHAVLPTRDRGPLVGREVEHLVEREGQHDEVEPGALDAEVADEGRRHRPHRDPDREREEDADAVVLQEVARHVGRPTEEGRLAERQQPCVAHEQVETQAEDREDPDLGRDRLPDEDGEQHDRGQNRDPRSAHRMPFAVEDVSLRGGLFAQALIGCRRGLGAAREARRP